MADWKPSFKIGISFFQAGEYQHAITSFSEALKSGGDPAIICDSRAAVHQKMGNLKDALRDSKIVINCQPARWQGYARSAHLFHKLGKLDAASRMVDLALERIPSHQSSRRDDMLTLQHQVQSARQEAAKEATRLASQRAYHFGKLPVEIAHSIFSLLLVGDYAYIVILAQVCKNWRSIILATPMFWSILVLKEKRVARKIRTWKERSRGRIRELVLAGDFSLSPVVLDELSKLPLKSLNTLRLEDFPVSQLPIHLPSIGDVCLQALPGLRHGKIDLLKGRLQWYDSTPIFSPTNLSLHPRLDSRPDWALLSHSLTELETGHFNEAFSEHDWHNALWLLHRNANLVDLRICSWRPTIVLHSVPDRELPPTILLPNLSSLELVASVPGPLLECLVLPSLKTLRVCSCPSTFNHALRHLANGKAPKLTSLTVRSTAFDARLMISVLAAIPTLEILELTSIGIEVKAVLEALSRAPNPQHFPSEDPQDLPSILCPSLRHLDCSSDDTVRGGELVRLVKMRLTEAEKGGAKEDVSGLHVQPLQTLVADCCPNLDSDVLPWLRKKVPSVSCVYMTKKAAAWKR